MNEQDKIIKPEPMCTPEFAEALETEMERIAEIGFTHLGTLSAVKQWLDAHTQPL